MKERFLALIKFWRMIIINITNARSYYIFNTELTLSYNNIIRRIFALFCQNKIIFNKLNINTIYYYNIVLINNINL